MTLPPTPLVRLGNLFPDREVYAKCEFLAPSGCFKIRGATHLLEHIGRVTPWAPEFIDAAWVQQHVSDLGDLPAGENVGVFIETGVSGQSADIVLESEPRAEDIAHTSEQEAVKAVGGLHIVGTERHESRRIDNQLRGRAGRQGDPGSSRFYVSLEDELDVGRGTMICAPAEPPVAAREVEATVCWLGESPGRVGGRYLLKHTTRSEPVKLDAVRETLDIATLTGKPGGDSLGLNDIARVSLRCASELVFDPYEENRWMGAFILIDSATNDTVGAGMIAA